MRFSISIPQLVPAGGCDLAALRAYLARAEALGFEAAFVQEQLLGPAPALSPLATLAYAAACTERIRLACAVLVTPLHSPVHLARETASIDQLSKGRLELGVVAGGTGRPYGAFGLSPEGAVSRFEEGLALLEALWRDEPVNLDSRFWHLEEAVIGLKPVQRPHPPLWLGGNHPDALRRAVRLGQGFIGAGSQSTAAFADQAATVARLVEATGRSGFRTAKRVYLAIDDDASRARTRLVASLQQLYGSRLGADRALGFAVAGTAEDVRAGLQEVIAAGAEMVLLNPLYDEAEQMERLVAEILPQLHERSV